MKTKEALGIVLELARDKAVNDFDEVEERLAKFNRQMEALVIVQKIQHDLENHDAVIVKDL